jgi:hypothetical protein
MSATLLGSSSRRTPWRLTKTPRERPLGQQRSAAQDCFPPESLYIFILNTLNLTGFLLVSSPQYPILLVFGARCDSFFHAQEGSTMADILFIAGTLLFLGVTWMFVRLCERV